MENTKEIMSKLDVEVVYVKIIKNNGEVLIRNALRKDLEFAVNYGMIKTYCVMGVIR